MTDTTTMLPTPPPETTAVPDMSIHPADILMHLVVSLLAPMFLACSAGNIDFARMAAFETVNAYRARSQDDLISIAQIIGFGLAALGSLGLSMTDDISLTMTLRLRGNAVALNRSAEQNRRALQKSRAEAPRRDANARESDAAAPLERDDPATGQFDQSASSPATAAAPAPAAKIQPLAQPAQASIPLASIPETATSTSQTPITAERRSQLAWATAMADEAALLTADIADLPPQQRETAARHAAALTRTAATLIAETNAAPPDLANPFVPPASMALAIQPVPVTASHVPNQVAPWQHR